MSDLVLRVTELIGVIVAERVAVEVSVLKQERDDWRKRAEAAEAKLLEVRKVVAPIATLHASPIKTEPEEVEGFRVGDLVSAYGLSTEPIARFVQDFAELDKQGLCLATAHLARKPVEVGDTVRISPTHPGSGRTWKVREITANAGRSIAWFVGEGNVQLADCIAVAP